MLNVGLTGGIASGKSIVVELLAAKGALIIDFDQLTRYVQEPGRPAWNELVSFFGREVINDDETINRGKLGEIVFEDAQKLARLNAKPVVSLYIYKESSANTIKIARLGYETGAWPLFEIENGQFKLNYSPEKLMFLSSIIGLSWIPKIIWGILIDRWFNKKVWITLRKQNEILTSRSGQSKNRKSVKTLSSPCIYPFMQISIRSNGKINQCCNDALGKETLGDTNYESLESIWYGHDFVTLRLKLLQSRSLVPMCKHCDTNVIPLDVR